MPSIPKHWKRGRGKLGSFASLLGEWSAKASSPMGPVSCTREFSTVLGGKYIQLVADWKVGKTSYQEIAMIGEHSDGKIAFWSFTSDGKNSTGVLADVTDVYPLAIGFEAHMPAGRARMIYWPDDTDGFHWAVESKNKGGWKRFTEHHYRKA